MQGKKFHTHKIAKSSATKGFLDKLGANGATKMTPKSTMGLPKMGMKMSKRVVSDKIKKF